MYVPKVLIYVQYQVSDVTTATVQQLAHASVADKDRQLTQTELTLTHSAIMILSTPGSLFLKQGPRSAMSTMVTDHTLSKGVAFM